MSKPTVVLVPGSWHTPKVYDGVIKALEPHGYPCIRLPLPSVGAVPANEDFTEDVAAIRDCVNKLVEKGEEVVVILHSYAGLPGGEALKGLGMKERAKEGKKGGVIRLIFIMAYVVPEGFQLALKGDTSKTPPWMKVDKKTRRCLNVFYNDLSDADAEHWAAQLQHQSMGVYSSTTTYAVWCCVPSTFIIVDNGQNAFTAQFAERLIDGVKQIEPTAFDVVERCDAGHCLMISRPEWTANVLRRAAGEKIYGDPGLQAGLWPEVK